MVLRCLCQLFKKRFYAYYIPRSMIEALINPTNVSFAKLPQDFIVVHDWLISWSDPNRKRETENISLNALFRSCLIRTNGFNMFLDFPFMRDLTLTHSLSMYFGFFSR